MSEKCSKCGEVRQEGDPGHTNGVCCFCGYWAVTIGPDRERARYRRKLLDFSAMTPVEGVLLMAATQIAKGLNPHSVRVGSGTYANIEMGLRYQHEYIDEESRSFLVLRTPERLLVFVDRKLEPGVAFMIFHAPDSELEFVLAC